MLSHVRTGFVLKTFSVQAYVQPGIILTGRSRG
jgi:hypothetical protein